MPGEKKMRDSGEKSKKNKCPRRISVKRLSETVQLAHQPPLLTGKVAGKARRGTRLASVREQVHPPIASAALNDNDRPIRPPLAKNT